MLNILEKRNMQMKWAVIPLVAASILVGGCSATSITYRYEYAPPSNPVTFEVKDLRSAKEKQGEILSLVVTSDQYGIYKLGDEQVSPDRVKYLSDLLASRSGSRLSGKTVAIRKFEILNNQQAALRASSLAGALGGVVGTAISASAHPNDNAFIDVSLEVEIEGNVYAAKSLSTYVIDRWAGVSKETVAEEIRKAMESAVDDLARQMSAAK